MRIIVTLAAFICGVLMTVGASAQVNPTNIPAPPGYHWCWPDETRWSVESVAEHSGQWPGHCIDDVSVPPVHHAGNSAETDTCAAGTALVTIDGTPHCQILNTAGMQCQPGEILVVGPAGTPACASGVIVGAHPVNVGGAQGGGQVYRPDVATSPQGGTPHCAIGTELVSLNGVPMCKGATHTVCEPEFYRKLVPHNAINVAWDPEGCTFRYQLIN